MCDFSFRSRKDPKQSLIVQKFNKSLGFLGGFRFSEGIPSEAMGAMAKIVRENGRYYACVKKMIDISPAETQGRVVAIDPGVRTFATTYSGDEVTQWGDGLQDRLFAMALQVDGLIGRRTKLLNKAPESQWRDDMASHLQVRIDRLRVKKKDIVNDLHKQLAYWLVTEHKFILLPSFETKQMTGRSKRKLRKKTIRNMLDLGHYKFKQTLMWMAKKYGATLVEVNEAYTSKTRSWDGFVNPKLGGSKTISDGQIIVDRDHNGARGILSRSLFGTCPLPITGERYAFFAG